MPPLNSERILLIQAFTVVLLYFLPECEDVPDGFDSRSVVSNDSLVSSVNSDSDNNDDSGEATPLQYTNGVCDYGLNGDNLDWLRRPSIYSKDKDTESVHWFNLLAYDNRVANLDLNDDAPIRHIIQVSCPHQKIMQNSKKTLLCLCFVS